MTPTKQQIQAVVAFRRSPAAPQVRAYLTQALQAYRDGYTLTDSPQQVAENLALARASAVTINKLFDEVL